MGLTMSEAEENKFDPDDKLMKLPWIIKKYRSIIESKEFTKEVFSEMQRGEWDCFKSISYLEVKRKVA